MRATIRLFAMGLLLAATLPAFATNDRAALGKRCHAAIADNGVPAAGLKETMGVAMGGSGWLFQYADPAGATWSCQVCDDGDPAAECGSMGLMLTLKPASGEPKQMPAELDRKCVFYLSKEVKPRDDGRFIAHEIAARVKATPRHTDARYVWDMSLDDQSYRCVIRKSDGSFRVEHQQGEEWRPIAAGIMW
ncbi:MAG TPA: hypothetical protein VFL14_09155 [Xanthomonadales bacterium]|nr:hypothetical protein [Xanthomonadales bacterium]